MKILGERDRQMRIEAERDEQETACHQSEEKRPSDFLPPGNALPRPRLILSMSSASPTHPKVIATNIATHT